MMAAPVSLWGKHIGLWKSPMIPPAQMLTENYCWLCRFTPHQMSLLWKFSVPFLVKPALSTKNMQLIKKGHSLYCQRNHWQFLVWVKIKQTDLVPTANSMGTVNVYERAMYHRLGCLSSINAGVGILLYFLVHAFSHQIFMHFSTFLSQL